MTPFRIAGRWGGSALLACAMLLIPAATALAAGAEAAGTGLPTATNGRILVVPAPEVRERYNLPDWMDDDWTLVIHKGNMLVDRNMLIDEPRSNAMDDSRAIHWPALFGRFPCKRPLGIVVDGNLKVHGSIINTSAPDNPALIVTGRTSADSLLTGSSYIAFEGPARFSEAIYGFGPEGELLFAGPVKTPLLINSGHKLELQDKSGTSGIGTYFNARDPAQADTTRESGGILPTDPHASRVARRNSLPHCVAAVVRPQLRSLSAIQEALLDGQPVLKHSHHSP